MNSDLNNETFPLDNIYIAIKEYNGQVRFIFQMDPEKSSDDRYRGKLLIKFNTMFQIGTDVCPRKITCKKLEPWEFVKYRLLG